MVLDLPTGNIARRELIKIDEDKSVFDAAKMIVENNRGSVLVTRGGESIGILTERDVMRKVVARSLDPKSVKVKEVMTSPPVTIDKDRPLREAVEVMNRKKIRRMLVTEKGKIIGVFTIRDVVKHMRTCTYCGKEIRSILESEKPEPYAECECGSRYHRNCVETVVNCLNCGRTLVTSVSYPEPSETFSG
ncbi:MAG: CBS domain-containing protein [Thaumarchaeota archaeon]|nr:CBS domain-containing protein [Nitrososphaerota archaeon]